MFNTLYAKYKPYYSDNLTLAMPIVVSQLGHTVVHMADSVIVGQFAGTIQLAAVSLVNSIFMLILVIGLGIAYGLTPLIAQENGRNEKEQCGRLLINSLIINIGVGIILYLFVHFGTLIIIDHIGQSPEVVAYAKPYLGYLGISIIPLMIFQTFKQFAEGLGFTKQAMFVSIWGNFVNIILGIILVKGMFGLSPMGVKGVGISTLIDRCLMAAVMSIYVLRSKHFKSYLRTFKLRFLEMRLIKNISKIGAPVSGGTRYSKRYWRCKYTYINHIYCLLDHRYSFRLFFGNYSGIRRKWNMVWLNIWTSYGIYIVIFPFSSKNKVFDFKLIYSIVH